MFGNPLKNNFVVISSGRFGVCGGELGTSIGELGCPRQCRKRVGLGSSRDAGPERDLKADKGHRATHLLCR